MSAIARCVALVVGLFIANMALAQSPFYPMSPVRLMDTRPGGTTIDGQSAGGTAGMPLQGGGTYPLVVAGRGGIPATGVNAVVLNITVTNPGAAGFLIAWPSGISRPTASNINYVGGQSVSGQTIVKLGSNGKVSLFVNGGTISANVVVDVAGYFPTTADYVPVTPARLLDTRAGTTTADGLWQGIGAIGTATAGGTIDLPVLGRNNTNVPATGVKALVVNITATNTTQAGFLVAWPSLLTRPNPASNINFVPGQTIANLAIINPGTNGNISIFANRGPTDVVVDVVGYLPSTVDFSSVTPARLADTRAGQPTIDGQYSGIGALANQGTLDLLVTSRGGIPAGAAAVALNVTVANATQAGFITVWPKGTPSTAPTAMQVNFAAGQTIQSQVIAQVGADGKVSLANIMNGTGGSTDVIVDVQGWFPAAPNDGASPIGYPTISCSGAVPPIKSGDTPVIPGVWSNPDRAGTGWNLTYYDPDKTKLSVTWFTYGAGHRPIWLLSETAFIDGTTNQWTAPLLQYAIDSTGAVTSSPVGTVAIQFISGSATRAAIRWSWNFLGTTPAPDECINNYFADTSGVAGAAMLTPNGTVDESYSGLWSDPKHSGWSLIEMIGVTPSGNTNLTTEAQGLTVYDSSGVPVWLIGQLGPSSTAPSTGSVPSTLEYRKATYLVNSTCNSSSGTCWSTSPVGTLTRSFPDTATEVVTISASAGVSVTGSSAHTVVLPSSQLFPNSQSLPNTPETYPATLSKYIGNNYLYVSQTYCLLTGTQTGCQVIVSWNDSQGGNLYQRNLITNAVTPVTLDPSGNTAHVSLSAGADVQFELHTSTATSRILLTSAEVKVSPASPICTSESASIAILPIGATTQRILATGVQNATAVTFPTWWLTSPNQADIQWIAGVNDGGGNWHADINLAQFDPGTARYGSFETDVYMSSTAYNNGSQVMCGGGTWIRSQDGVPAPPVSATTVVTPIPTSTDSVSDAVGATAAQFRVDEGGNATYSVPIQVAPGTAGMTPKLALSYNSRLPGGVMGPGWSIEGASAISRCRQTRESGDFMSGTTPIDGNPPPVNFTQTDRFCLDGVRLLRTSSGNDGDDGTTYSPETDPTIQVTAHTSNTAIGPNRFTVQRKDGSTSTYGNTTASTSALVTATPSGTSQAVNVSWNLARVQDSTGNYIDYLYQSRPAAAASSLYKNAPFASVAVETVLSQVNYTGHATDVSPYASVTFSYSSLPNYSDLRLAYQGGVVFLQSQQLSSVTVSDSGFGTIRYYALSYSASTAANNGSGSALRRLAQIKECRDSTAQSVCFAPTVFNWSQANNAFVPQGQGQSGPDFSHFVSLKMADVDGDGRQDIVWASNDGVCGSNSHLFVGFLSGSSNGQMTLDVHADRCASIDLTNNDRAWYLLDYDGDGRADLLIGGAGGASGSNWSLYLSRGNRSGAAFDTVDQFAAGPHPLSTPIAIPPGTNAAAILADVNGDGLPDLIVPTNSGSTINTGIGGQLDSGLAVRLMVRSSNNALTFADPSEIILGLNHGDTTCDPSNATCSINFFNTNPRHGSTIISDLNGDGRADLTFLIQATPCAPLCQEALVSGGSPALTFDPMLGVPQSGLSQATLAPVPGGSTSYWYQFTANGISTVDGGGQILLMTQYTSRFDTSGGGDLILPAEGDKIYSVDLNGDGLADILYQDLAADPLGQTYVALINNGKGYEATTVSVAGITNGAALQLIDIDGDGKTDIVYFDNNHKYSYVTLLESGSGWVFSVAKSVPATGSTQASFPANSQDGSIIWTGILGDFDGDGIPDIFSYETHQGATNSYYTSRVDTGSRYHPRDVITDFNNGLGAKTTVAYQPLTNIGVYQRGGASGYPALTSATYGWGSPVFDVLAPMFVVSQATSDAPTVASAVGKSTIAYRYGGATMQAGGRGFLGFSEIWSFDANDTGSNGSQYVATVNRYAQRFPFIGMPISTRRLVLNGTTVDFGDPTLNACAVNIEATGYNCFSGITGTTPTFVKAWPDLTTSGIWVSNSLQQPMCTGAGCNLSPALNQCIASTALVLPSLPSGDPTTGSFTPVAAAAPIFAYVASTADTQYDLSSSGAGVTNAVAVATTRNFFCYEGTNGSSPNPGHGNLLWTLTVTLDSANNIFAQKDTANTYGADNATLWYWGRLTNSIVHFMRTGITEVKTRTSDFTYDPGTGLLTSEEIQKGGTTDQDLLTQYDLDVFGNRIGASQCNRADHCTVASTTQQQSGTDFFRYARTTYTLDVNDRGRYVTGSSLPFYSVGGPGNYNVVQATSVDARDEFGNATQQHSVNDTNTKTQFSKFGVMGRPYFAGDSSGHAATTTFGMCGGLTKTGVPVTCSTDTARFKFRSQTLTVGAPSSWTYFDVLGRPAMQIVRSFNNTAGQLYSGTCSFFDAHGRGAYKTEPFFVGSTAASDGSPNLNGVSPCSDPNTRIYATTPAYDALGRVTKLTNPDGNTTQNQYVGLATFTTDPRGNSWETDKNVMGETTQTIDPNVDTSTTCPGYPTLGLKINQTFDAAGDVMAITRDACNGHNGTKPVTTTFTYDMLGRKLTQTDADSGKTSFAYNAAGDVVTQTDAKGSGTNLQSVNWSYDALGRKWQRVTSNAVDGNNMTDTWTYDTASNGYGQLANEAHLGTGTYTAFSRAVSFDGLGRLYQRTTTIGTATYTETTAYDSVGRVRQQQDATGHITLTHYSALGYVDAQSDTHVDGATTTINSDANSVAQSMLYELLSTNARGQPVSERRGGTANLQTTNAYQPDTGRISTVCSGNGTGCGLQDLSYLFDAVGNLTTRVRNYSGSKNPAEVLAYDALNRLTSTKLGSFSGTTFTTLATQAMTYDTLGNLCKQVTTGGITNKSQTYTYSGYAACTGSGSGGASASSAAVAQISGTTNSTYQYDADGNQTVRSDGRTLSYNVLNQIAKATLGSSVTTFEYGPDGDRFVRNDNGAYTYYVGKVEIQKTNGTVTEMRRYLGAAIDLIVTNTTRYTFGDHLGSVDTIATKLGTRYEAGSFDAWGNRRNPDNWQQVGNTAPLDTTTHGFTGHEHVDTFGFIHMNGRIYDPQLGKMLQADPMAGPGSQGLNRYSYVANNPLTLTDPSGYSWWANLIHTVVDYIAYYYFGPVGVGAVDAVWAYETTGGNLGATATAFVSGYFGSQLSQPTGGWQGFINDPETFLITDAENSLSQGFLQGTLAALNGHSFGSAFRSAATSTFVSSFGPSGDGVQYAISRAIVGGTASEITGGKFANGAETALFQWAADSALEKYQVAQAQQQPQGASTEGSSAWQPENPAASTILVAFAGGENIDESTVDTLLTSASSYYTSVGIPINFVEAPFGTPDAINVQWQGFYFRSNAPLAYNGYGYRDGTVSEFGINLSIGASSNTLVHELGHALGLLDQYTDDPKLGSVPLPGYANNLMGQYNGTNLNSYQIGVIQGNLIGGYHPYAVGRELKFQ